MQTSPMPIGRMLYPLLALIRAKVLFIDRKSEIKISGLGIYLFLLLRTGPKLNEHLFIASAVYGSIRYAERAAKREYRTS